MTSFQTSILIIAIVFLFILITGLWLKRKGSPYPSGMVNLHKFLSLGTFVFLIITVYPVQQEKGIYTLDWLYIIITLVSTIAAFTTGALLTRYNPPAKKFMNWLHSLSWLLVVVFAGIIVYRLF
jgi:uncharacterized membrane protein